MADKTTTAAGPRPADLREPLVSHGTRHQVGANRPVELAGDTAWYVLDGILDLFLQQHVAGTYGRRRLLGTVGAGTLAWLGGEPEIPPGWRLLAVGRAGTELISVRGTALRQMIEPAALARHVEDFTAAMPDGAGGPAGPAAPGPAAPAAQAPGAEPPASPDARISAARQTFGAAVAQTVRRAAQADEADSERIGSEQDRQHRILDSALADLVEVVDRREPLGRAPGSQLAQLNLALARIGRQLGVDIPAQRGLEEDDRDPVGARVTAAGCRARVVTLHAGWWSQAGTVLLGFIADGDSPVALIPARSRYLLFDPSTGDTVRVDQELAGRLAPQAYAIYRPLPAEAHSAKALLGSVLPRLRQEVWLLVALGTLAGLVTLITPMVTSVVYNQVLPTGNRSLLLAISLLLIGATITWGLVALAQNLVVVRISGHLEASLDPGLMDRILQLPATFLRRYDTGDLATRAGGLQIIRQQLSGAVVTSFLTLTFSVFNVVLLFVYSALLGAVALGILVVVAAVLVLLNLRVIAHEHRVFDFTGDNAADLFQILRGVNKMRIAGAEARLMARWASRFRLQQRETYSAGRLQAWIFAVIAALPSALSVGLFGVAGAVLVGKISPGDFIATVTALGQFTAALTGVALTVGPLLTVIPLWQRLLPVLSEPVEEIVTAEPGILSGQISVRDVSFSYDPGSPPVIQDVSFDVRPGEFVAITGPSGSGKSTLLRLLLGLDQPSSGTVLYDGKDLKALDPRAVRRQFGVVMQEARPLPGEILSTILGDSTGDEADAWAAAEAAELADDIRQMPMRMHTILGEGGLAFSGGQVQRMMIARALARKPRLLFFDEATSALDDRAQAQVSQHIDALRTTRVVIAHRLSTIRNADRIYVLEDGRLVQAGTFDELMAVEGTFKRLAARQMV
ncbi:MAG TPA: NHLP bacteriocin export ABC transporter permease/ATPase subunit [Actinobacteria bacterium]|nr:NHLP bacteriocin export ABC transporter permease/ATPase subunit [Actinomycetota bacterium]